MNKENAGQQKLPKKIHVTGICGVATSALAIAFHRAGVSVNGSDKGFFPPVSTELERAGVAFYAGWHPEKMVENGVPDLIIIPTASGNNNPETLYAKEKGLNALSYTQVFRDYFIKKNSIVVAGTWGKTSSSALLSHVMLSAGFDPSYMFGGISLSHESAAYLGKSDWSVFEGDEYKSGPSDPTAKFFYYKPTHFMLTAVSWDHADLYPTEKSYFDTFKKLVSGIPNDGLIVANKDQDGVIKTLEKYKGKVVWYGELANKASKESLGSKTDFPYAFGSVYQTKKGISFAIRHGGESWHIDSPLLGAFQAENITGCFAMAHTVGVPAEKIIAAIASFRGMKRRLEKRLDGDVATAGITVFDDIAHSPEKAASVLKELRNIYQGKVIAIFEPNIGGRERGSAGKYDNAFRDADMVVIPRLTKLKISEKDQPMEGDELAATIFKTHKNCVNIDDDAKLVEKLISETKKGDIIAFLGSHGFRNMIEEVVRKLS
jgi:UDP-N-acetylmuramate: L-alanyl-gamma-D-glutamyl-meso-diaminopimelate ligase